MQSEQLLTVKKEKRMTLKLAFTHHQSKGSTYYTMISKGKGDKVQQSIFQHTKVLSIKDCTYW